MSTAGGHAHVTLVAYADVMVRNLLTTIMQDEGYCVLSAADGQEALELSRLYPGAIDLLVTDVEMTRLTCTDLCSRLLEERPGVKVLVILGTDMNGILRPNVNPAAVPRPSEVEMLKEKVRAILAASLESAPFVYLAFLGRPLLESGTRTRRSPRRVRGGLGALGGAQGATMHAAVNALVES
jgi:CheY-like chemotaxis protein